MSDESLRYDKLRHALGVRLLTKGRWSKPYRNHFDAAGDDIPAFDAMVAAGLATRSCRHAGSGCFHVTGEGRAMALAGLTYKRLYGYGTPTHGEPR